MTWDEIKELVEKNGDVKTVTMEKLRDAHGVAKLGVNVRANISRQLAGMGLGHVPVELPSFQHDPVRLYKRGTPIGELIEEVLTASEPNDTAVAARVGGNQADYAGMIATIREIVTE